MQDVVLKELQEAIDKHNLVLEITLEPDQTAVLRSQLLQLFYQMDRLVSERLARQDDQWLQAIDSLKKYKTTAEQASLKVSQQAEVITHAAQAINVLDKVINKVL
ncbi:hypothetical protein QWZ04_12020 [Vibrio tapetis subsp. quintayensis]|uniref:hypothetical protein n=1 Tax=Vibrio tapetis TaxID=52443 RepID=UPI0025B30498|nr:hypothetical protein [Vibrio tapetis]MDN3681050.1 hypothetical protein [Vibrio tapetis subsp. quintayensis]